MTSLTSISVYEVLSLSPETRLTLLLWNLISDALKQMLNLNDPQGRGQAAEPVWKILVYDRYGQDIISPLVSIKDLRELGVTLHV